MGFPHSSFWAQVYAIGVHGRLGFGAEGLGFGASLGLLGVSKGLRFGTLSGLGPIGLQVVGLRF